MIKPGVAQIGPVLTIVLALAAWELAERIVAVPHPAVPAPSAIGAAFASSQRVLLSNLQPTLIEASFGFVFGSVAGVSLAVILFAWRSAEAALFKIVVTIHSV